MAKSNKNSVLNNSGITTSVVDDEQDYVSRKDMNRHKQPVNNPVKNNITNHPSEFYCSPGEKKEPEENEGREKSYFKIVGRNKKPNKSSLDFYNEVLKNLVGDVFDYDIITGELTPKGGMDKVGKSNNKKQLNKSINKIISSSKVSKKLAETIRDGIYAKNQKEPILFIIVDDDLDSNSIYFDDYFDGKVDASDFHNITLNPNIDPDPNGILNGTPKFKEVIQATMFAHIVAERFATDNYQQNMDTAHYDAHHIPDGEAKEFEIINDMMLQYLYKEDKETTHRPKEPEKRVPDKKFSSNLTGYSVHSYNGEKKEYTLKFHIYSDYHRSYDKVKIANITSSYITYEKYTP